LFQVVICCVTYLDSALAFDIVVSSAVYCALMRASIAVSRSLRLSWSFWFDAICDWIDLVLPLSDPLLDSRPSAQLVRVFAKPLFDGRDYRALIVNLTIKGLENVDRFKMPFLPYDQGAFVNVHVDQVLNCVP